MNGAAAKLGSPPTGLVLERLGDQPGAAHAEARSYCLGVIKSFYGFDYRSDWHGDLDSLTRDARNNHYSAANRGAFWTLRDKSSAIVATAGIKRLGWHQNILDQFPERYRDAASVATLMRAYVREDQRGHGLGTWLNALCESEAATLGYRTLYLHASSDTQATIAFWTARGYADIGRFGFSTHFDKPLAPRRAT
jgi:GNAT superfamily N-acetyltransferase